MSGVRRIGRMLGNPRQEIRSKESARIGLSQVAVNWRRINAALNTLLIFLIFCYFSFLFKKHFASLISESRAKYQTKLEYQLSSEDSLAFDGFRKRWTLFERGIALSLMPQTRLPSSDSRATILRNRPGDEAILLSVPRSIETRGFAAPKEALLFECIQHVQNLHWWFKWGARHSLMKFKCLSTTSLHTPSVWWPLGPLG